MYLGSSTRILRGTVNSNESVQPYWDSVLLISYMYCTSKSERVLYSYSMYFYSQMTRHLLNLATAAAMCLLKGRMLAHRHSTKGETSASTGAPAPPRRGGITD